MGTLSNARPALATPALGATRKSRNLVKVGSGPLSPRQAGQLARACLENSEALLSDAELLLEHGRHASAVAWALLALEEFGKHMMCSLAATISFDDADAWRDFWRQWRTHPKKLKLAAGRFIDLVVDTDSGSDDIWRLAYDDLREQIPDINRSKQDAIYVDWKDGKPASPVDSVEYEAASALVGTVGVVVRSGQAMWGEADLGEVWERSAAPMGKLKASMLEALKEHDAEAYLKAFEDLIREL